MHFLISSILLLILPLLSTVPPSVEIDVIKFKEGVYIYRSYGTYEGTVVSANGLIVESSNEVILIDSPWDERQTVQLLEWIEREIGKPVSYAIITHAHKDRIGGIDIIKSRKIPTISGFHTAEEAAKKGYTRPEITFKADTLLSYGQYSLEAYYPGPGHTTDNTVVYLKDHGLLYGGCFLKSASSASLGNIEEASLDEWPHSLRKVMNRYPDREVEIPGHGDWDPGAIENTLKLLSDAE